MQLAQHLIVVNNSLSIRLACKSNTFFVIIQHLLYILNLSKFAQILL